jgi:ribosomal protein L11 methyltransferase
LIRLAVRCGPAAAERVLAELLQLAPGGVEEEQGPGWVEYAIYGAEGELPDLGEVEAVAGDEPIEVSSAEVPDDWGDRWRDFHRPVSLAEGRVVIRPSWEEPPPAASSAPAQNTLPSADASGSSILLPRPGAAGSVVDVVIDPGQAFGTGAHPTTRMCIEFLVEMADEGKASGPLADLGTGSGVLAIAAAKLGFGPVLGIDHETAAVEAAGVNASANGVELRLERVNLREEVAPLAETTVANLTAPLLLELGATIAGRPDRVPRTLLLSGLLSREASDVGAAFAAAGMAERSRRSEGDWTALRLEPR